MPSISKAAAAYRNRPHGSQRCDACSMYRQSKAGAARCTLVIGAIAPHGWCRYFKRA